MRAKHLLVACLPLLFAASACNPTGDTIVRDGFGITDFFTVRADPDGAVVQRDIAPSDASREAITGDDYFGIKLEHIYAGGMVGRDVGNLAIVSSIDGILPNGVHCSEIPENELGFAVSEQQQDNRTGNSLPCAFNSIVQVNPVFRDSHVTFDSVFITPPFRLDRDNLRLQFIIAQLNDVSLAQDIVNWVQDRTEQLASAGVFSLNEWQAELIDIGFTAVNHLLERAAAPTYMFEMTTEFVPVETVEGNVPQNLLMGGDFVAVGMSQGSVIRGGMMASDSLVFSSGRLYWQDSREEYTDTPYIVFKVVRFSRYPGALPEELSLSQVNRNVRRGIDPSEAAAETRNIILDLQDARIMNETEGEMMLDLFEWYADGTATLARLEDHEYTAEDIPLAWSELSPAMVAGVLPLTDIAEGADLMRQLEERIYGNYGQTPGLRQDECVTLTSMTQDFNEAVRSQLPSVVTAVQNMQLRRVDLQRNERRSDDEQSEFDRLMQTEPLILGQLTSLPGCEDYATTQTCDASQFTEPVCPALRQAYVGEE